MKYKMSSLMFRANELLELQIDIQGKLIQRLESLKPQPNFSLMDYCFNFFNQQTLKVKIASKMVIRFGNEQ
jgi:hypothetical protein